MSTRRLLFVLGAYAAMAAVALGLAIGWNHTSLTRYPSPAWALGEHAWSVSVGLGLAVALLTILSTRWLLARTRWARALRAELKLLVGGASSAPLIGLALASGIAEELLFRGALQPMLGYVASSVVFGLMHIGPRREFLPWTAWAVVMGLVLGGIYEGTGVIEGPIVAHVLVNAVNLHVIARHEGTLDRDDGRMPPPKLVSRVRRDGADRTR